MNFGLALLIEAIFKTVHPFFLYGWLLNFFYFPIVIDASAKIPDGLFLGNTHIMGAFDECLNLETPSILKWKNEFIEGFRWFVYTFVTIYNIHYIFYRGQYISVYVGFDDDKKEQEKLSRMPILLPQSQGMLQVGLFVIYSSKILPNFDQ